MFFDTLVKLAELGASGISIFAIFWTLWMVKREPDSTKMKTYRAFIFAAVMIAVVSYLGAALNFYFNSTTTIALEKENAARVAILTEQKLTTEQLNGQLVASEQKRQRIIDHIAIVIGSKAVNAKRGNPVLKESIKILNEAVKNR